MREWPWVFKDECNGHTRTEHPLHVLAFSFTQSDFNKNIFGIQSKISKEHITPGVRESHRKFEIVFSDVTS